MEKLYLNAMLLVIDLRTCLSVESTLPPQYFIYMQWIKIWSKTFCTLSDYSSLVDDGGRQLYYQQKWVGLYIILSLNGENDHYTKEMYIY